MPKSRRPSIHNTPFLHRTSRMPSPRRIKVFALLTFLFVVTVLFYTNSLRQQRPRDLRTANDFYSKTLNALPKDLKKGGASTDSESKSGDEDVKARTQRLQDAAKLAKEKANSKSPKPDAPSDIEGVGSAAEGARDRGVAGRKKIPAGSEAQEKVKEETKEEHDVEVELNSILKKSPIIIFSKSYCPYSKKAKDILLKKYSIDPEPFVVELDKHELGAQLQAKLGELTKRRTVPNILINGISIGGGDDIADMDDKGTLIAQIKKIGQKKIVEAIKRPVEKMEPVKEKEEGSQAPIHGL